MKTCIINVGVNASHGALRSPIFPDGNFAFVPIPENMGYSDCGNIVRYKDLASSRFISSKHLELPVHQDPEFVMYTYGDYPEDNPRAANLARLEVGDTILFYARLVHWKDGAYFRSVKIIDNQEQLDLLWMKIEEYVQEE